MAEEHRPKITPRRVIGALVLGIGVWLIGNWVAPTLPRTVEIRIDLRAFREAPVRARAVSVSFRRSGETVRTITERFDDRMPPAEWVHEVDIAPGEYRAHVAVELDRMVQSHEIAIAIVPGEPNRVRAPNPP